MIMATDQAMKHQLQNQEREMQNDQAMDQAMKHQVQKQGRVMKVDQDTKRSHDVWILSQPTITKKPTLMMDHVYCHHQDQS